MQNALTSRKEKVLSRLLNGDIAAYKRKKKKKKDADKVFKTEFSDQSADDLNNNGEGKLHSDNDKSDFEYESSEESFLNFLEHSDSDHEISFDSETLSENECISGKVIGRRYKRIMNVENSKSGNQLMKNAQKTNSISNPMEQKTEESLTEKLNKKGKFESGSNFKSEATSSPSMKKRLMEYSGINQGLVIGGAKFESSNKSISENLKEMNDKLKLMLKGSGEQFELSFSDRLHSPSKRNFNKQDGSLESIKSSKAGSQRLISIQPVKPSVEVDTGYLDKAVTLTAISGPDKTEERDPQLKNLIDQSKNEKIGHQEIDKTLSHKTGVQHQPPAENTARKDSDKQAGKEQQMRPVDDFLADIKNKKELLHKQKPVNSLADTLREHFITKEKQKKEIEELAFKKHQMENFFNSFGTHTNEQNKQPKPERRYEDINQFTNTSSKIDSWRHGPLTSFITLNKKEVKPPLEEVKEDDEALKFEKELLDPSKNFFDIMDIMLTKVTDNDIVLEKPVKETHRPTITAIKTLIMERKKKQIQLSRL